MRKKFLGDESFEFVRIGNRLMDFTALIYLFGFSILTFVVLEQPPDSVLPKCTSMKLVLKFSRSGRILTYDSAILMLERRRPDVSTSSLM